MKTKASTFCSIKKLVLHFFILIPFSYAIGQIETEVKYTLKHTLNTNTIEISIQFDSISSNTTKMVIPRSAPGTYELTNYISFVKNVKGYTTSNKVLKGIIGDGSFFIFEEKDEYLKSLSYEVDIKKMETDLLGGYASSKIRENYLGILGYSVFGFVEGLENSPIILEINTLKDWPIFSTLLPSIDRKFGTNKYYVENFNSLADAQYLLGNGVLIFNVKEAQIPLFVATYSETSIDMEEIGRRGLLALNGLFEYFGYIPMPHYTMCYEFLTPLSDRHDYGFNMEHMNSMTASLDTSQAISNYNPNAKIGSIVHHMGHSWIPLRSYGIGYRPFEWQTAPLIDTIWLNEGFIWYISYYSILDNKNILTLFSKTLENAPTYIQKKSLKELSLLGSTQYSMDFRIGRNLFSRGALLAHELNLKILSSTNSQKSFKDALLGLLKWTEINKRPFKYDEIETIISEAVGVDISDIWNKWQKPLKE